MSTGFDMEASQPLQLRRGSDANQRKSLLEKYNMDLNHTAEGTEYNTKKAGEERTGHNTEISMERLDEEIKTGRSKKVIYIAIGSFLGLIILVLILVFALKGGSDNPVNPVNPTIFDKIYNPYSLTQDSGRSDFSSRYYDISFDQSLLTKGNLSINYYKENKTDNKPIYNATLKTSMTSNYRTMRFQLYARNQYQVSDEWLNPSFTDHQFKEFLNHNEMNPLFSITINQNQREKVNQTAFHISASSPKDALYKETEEFLTTKNQELFLMDKYQHISFEVKSKRFMGWGERVTERLFLDDGNYTIFPQRGDGNVDNGTTGQGQGAGAHPFLAFQITNTSRWAGIFLFNSNPMSLELNKTGTIVNSNKTWSKLTIRTTGGALDFFVFYGPSYLDVIKQYQDVVGKPKMMASWAHGLFAQSPAYKNSTLALEAVQRFQSNFMPIRGLVLPMDYENSYFDSNSNSSLVDAIRNAYSPNQLKLIFPFTTFVSNTSNLSWVKSFNDGFDKKSFSVRFESLKLEVVVVNEATGEVMTGYCMDVFNPRFMSEFLEPQLLRNMREPLQGYWLQDNQPYIRNVINEIDDPFDIPYRPGQSFSSGTLKTLPETAIHEIGGQTPKQDHFYLHALFGSKLATQFIQNVFSQRVLSQRSFVITDSSFSGLGRTGAAHLLQAPAQPSYQDLERQLNGMILMNMFGMPNTGAPLCNTNQTNPSIEKICAKYFELAMISPLAIYRDQNNHSLSGHPFNFVDQPSKDTVILSIALRQNLVLYLREQLKKIETFGGALIRPAFTEFESLNKENDTSIDMTTVMFGDSYLVSYLFYDNNNTQKTVVFPKEANWISLLDNYKTYMGGDQYTQANNGIKIFQKSGTIVALNKNDQQQISELVIALQNDSISNTPRARGFIYREGQSNTDLDTAYIEVFAENNIISFKQQDIYAQVTNTNETLLEFITVVFSPMGGKANYACSVNKDLRTVQQLYVFELQDSPNTFRIFADKTKDPQSSNVFLKLDEIEHIFFGTVNDTNMTCDQLMFGYQFISNVTSDDKKLYTAYLKPYIMDMMPDYVKYQRLDIQITSNNSVTVKIADTVLPSTTTKESNQAVVAQDFDVTIDQILDEYIEGKYCFALKLPHNISFQQDYFSTCDAKHQNISHFQLHHKNMGIFNFDLPNTQEKYVSGLGERKGSFFLENGTTYAFYNNDNNVQDAYQSHGRKIVSGRNGFHNIIYAKHDASQNSFAVLFNSNEGREITYGVRDKDPSFAVQSQQKEVSINIYFDLDNESLAKAIFQPLINKSKTAKIPPAWAFGHHMTVPLSITQTVSKKIDHITNVLKFPLEGIIQESQNLDQSQNSMSFDPYLFNKDTIKYIVDKNLSLVTINTPTYPIAGKMPNDQNLGPIFNNNLSLSLYLKDDRPYLDYSRGGRICYLNNLLQSTTEIYQSQITNFVADNNLNKNKLGLSNYQNEISRPLCAIDSCWEANFDRIIDPLAFKARKPGNQLMTYDTLDDISSYFQSENQVHNIEGSAMNSIFIQSGSPSFIISQSTSFALSIKGQVARIFDYYESTDTDMQQAMQQMQAFSYQFGIPQVSVKFLRRPSLDKESVLKQILINTFSTTAAVQTQFVDFSNTTLNVAEIQKFRLALRIKYSLMAYTRTQVFRQMSTGVPVIRPMYLSQFDSVANSTDTIGTMYMFGPALLAQGDFQYSGKFYPYSNWCSVHGGLSETQICFNNQVDAKYDGQQMLFINQGTITPLYNYNRTAIELGEENFINSDNMTTLTLDLHMFGDTMGSGTSKGELFMDDGLGTTTVGAKWCYLQFEMIRENLTIQFTDVSQELGQVSKYNCSNMRSYQLNQVTIYAYSNFSDGGGNPMLQANITLKSNETVMMDLIEVDPVVAAGVFQVRSLTGQIVTINYFDIDSIKFSSEVPPTPSYLSKKKHQ